jgi:hypothetical protein
VRGLYVAEVFDDPAFAPQRRAWAELGAAVGRIVAQGVADGELRRVPAGHVERALLGTALATIWEPAGSGAANAADDAAGWPEAGAELLLRGLLSRPSRFPAVRRQAEAVLAAAGAGPRSDYAAPDDGER